MLKGVRLTAARTSAARCGEKVARLDKKTLRRA